MALKAIAPHPVPAETEVLLYQIHGIMRLFSKAVWPCGAMLFGLLTCGALHAAETKPGNAMTWCQFDLPPMYIVDGPDAGKGVVDEHVNFLIRHLPEYQHQIQVSNIRRVTEQIRNHEHVACAGLQKNPERESYMLFSTPFLGVDAPSLVLPRRNLERMRPYLNAAGEIRLAALIDNSPMILGIAFGRSYGRDIDAMIVKDRPNILVRPAAQDLTEALFRMMALKRVDYTIAYGGEFRALSTKLANTESELLSLPIEGLPRYIPVYIVAPQDDWGRTFIERVNQLLRTYWNDSEFRVAAFTGQTPAARDLTRAILRELNPNNSAAGSAHAKP